MTLNIVFNKKTNLYKIKSKYEIGEEHTLLLDLILKYYNDIKKYNVMIKQGKICSYNLDNIKKAKQFIEGIIVMKKFQGEIK